MRGSQVLSAPRPGTDAGRCPGGGEWAPGCRHRNSQNKKANYPSPAATWLACKLQVGLRGDPGPLRTSNSWPLVGSLALGLGARSLRPDTAPGRGLSVLLAACLACLWGRDFSLFQEVKDLNLCTVRGSCQAELERFSAFSTATFVADVGPQLRARVLEDTEPSACRSCSPGSWGPSRQTRARADLTSDPNGFGVSCAGETLFVPPNGFFVCAL